VETKTLAAMLVDGEVETLGKTLGDVLLEIDVDTLLETL